MPGDLVKMQFLIQSVWGVPESLHFQPAPPVMISLLTGGPHLEGFPDLKDFTWSV